MGESELYDISIPASDFLAFHNAYSGTQNTFSAKPGVSLSQPFPLPVQLSHSREMPLEEMLHSSFNILAFSPTNIICWGNIERC